MEREIIYCANELNTLHGNSKGIGYYLRTKNYDVDDLNSCMYMKLQGNTWGVLKDTLVFWRERKTQEEMNDEFDFICRFPPFLDWCKKYDFHTDPAYSLKWIEIQQIDPFGNIKKTSKGFLKFEPRIDKEGLDRPIPSIIFMRGDSVCILIVLIVDDGKKYSVLTKQPRIATGKSKFLEIPAGMLDGNRIISAGISEIEQETGILVNGNDLINMPDALTLTQKSLYMSPGGCDEAISFLVYEASATREQIQKLQGRKCGEKDEGEQINVTVVSLETVSDVCADAKTIAALYYYDRYVKIDNRSIPSLKIKPQ